MNVLSFQIVRSDFDENTLVPMIDGKSLIDLVTSFEKHSGMDDPAGGYGGLTAWFFSVSFEGYYLSDYKPVEEWPEGKRYMLYCSCGEPGCWPLHGMLRLKEDKVVWDRFSQPHRPQRDYSGFGPFVFDHKQYEAAVKKADADWKSS